MVGNVLQITADSKGEKKKIKRKNNPKLHTFVQSK